MIQSFECKYTKALSKGRHIKRFVNIETVARRNLRQLEIANQIEDLKVPPGYHLEYSEVTVPANTAFELTIKWRVCFKVVEYRCERCRNVTGRLV